MKKIISTLALGTLLFIGMSATAFSADGKCNGDKAPSAKCAGDKNSSAKCGSSDKKSKSEEKTTGKCAAGKCGGKCAVGKCGSK